jgi:hypothetical protein
MALQRINERLPAWMSGLRWTHRGRLDRDLKAETRTLIEALIGLL